MKINRLTGSIQLPISVARASQSNGQPALGCRHMPHIHTPICSPPQCVHMSPLVGRLVQRSRLILDRHIIPTHALILAPNEIRNLLVLGLLDGTLVVLRSLAHELLLDHVDACQMLD